MTYFVELRNLKFRNLPGRGLRLPESANVFVNKCKKCYSFDSVVERACEIIGMYNGNTVTSCDVHHIKPIEKAIAPDGIQSYGYSEPQE